LSEEKKTSGKKSLESTSFNMNVVSFVVLVAMTFLVIMSNEVILASKRFEKGVLLGYLLAQQRGIPYGG
jgi:hypothetical protein